MSTARSPSPALNSAMVSTDIAADIAADIATDVVAKALAKAVANVVADSAAPVVRPEATGDDDDDMHINENIDEIAAGDDDGKDPSDPHAYIERSLRYADLCLCLRHAGERVAHLLEFEKGMPLAKRPSNGAKGGCLALFKKKVDKAQKRVDDFRAVYASKRAIAKTKRAERLARDKLAKSHQDSLGKPLLDDLAKRFKIAKILAAKAAVEALRALPSDATKEQKKAAAEKAFDHAAGEAMKNGAILPDMAELAAEAAASNADMADSAIAEVDSVAQGIDAAASVAVQ